MRTNFRRKIGKVEREKAKRLKMLVGYLHPLLPGDPEVAPGKEAGDCVAGQVVDPTLVTQLTHYCVDPGEPCKHTTYVKVDLRKI